ncbi:hypothetical protein AMS68_005540 [Peltaster fructicola]|uniref:Enoyl reductase (ER) domain-containing protein n=1 Tax=Peltaster fructicola TaxID=286661 RepID=A0A6H0XZ36_9PEZI|nr:hypothetical protein AMS68_005540 [Peltaster fructicola]
MAAQRQSLIAPSFGNPSVYVVETSSQPTITSDTEVLVQVQAASINGHDTVLASGKTKALQHVPLPHRLGLDFAGTIIEVGAAVNDFANGDQVYGFYTHGAACTHLVVDLSKPNAVLSKVPAGLAMIEAASLPAVAITAIVALKRADTFLEEQGGLRGKTIFIPAALGGVGSVALQIAKHEWHCRTISSASTKKMSQVDGYLGAGVVDQLYDYTTTDVAKQVGKGKVDFVFDTIGKAGDYIPMIRKGGLCISIARLPPGSALKDDAPNAPTQSRVACIGQGVMNGIDSAFRLWAKTSYGVSRLLEENKIKAVVGTTAPLYDLAKIKEKCFDVANGRGGVGKFVIDMSAAR